MIFFGPSMMEKTVVEARAKKILGEFPVTVGGRGRAMRVSLVCMSVCVRRCALTEPERFHCRLRVTKPK
jgi:hypothetical protein